MTKEICYCDACGQEGALRFRYFVEREMDGAGSMENNYSGIDLCLKHAISLLSDYDKQANRTPILAIIEALKRPVGEAGGAK